MKKTGALLVLVFGAAISFGSNGFMQGSHGNAGESPSGRKGLVKLSMGTGGTGGAKSVYMGGLARIVSDNCSGIELVSEASGGSGADLALMEQDELQLSLIEAGPAHEAYYAEEEPFTRLRCVFGSYPTQFLIASLNKEYDNISDFDGKTIVVGPIGGSCDVSSRLVLPFLGVNPREYVNIQFNDSWIAVAEGRVDGYSGSCGNPASAILEAQTKADLNWIRFTEEQMQAVMAEYPYYVKVTVPNSYYNNLGGDYETIGNWMSIYALQDVDDDVIYEITKAVMENLDALVATTSQNAKNTQIGAVLKQSVPIHRGALKYYEEMGLEIPDNLRPAEAK